MRHKMRSHGETVQVLRGLAKRVQSEIAFVTSGAAIKFQFVSGYKGRPKVKIAYDDKNVTLVVCDSDHGKGRLTVAWQDPIELADSLRVRLTQQGYTVA